MATDRGGRDANADAAAVHYYGSGDVTTAVVVDGIGDGPDVLEMVPIAAEVIARTAARTTPVAGIMAAAAMTADTAYTVPVPDGVAVCVMVAPDRATKIAWVGDCRAYAWDGSTLEQATEDHTMGRRLRAIGADENLASKLDHWVRVTIGLATIAMVAEARIEADETLALILLTSDGVHDALGPEHLARIVRGHADDPQQLANVLVSAAVGMSRDHSEVADNATVVVLAP